MGRKEDPIWIEFTTIRPKSETKQHPDVACIYCASIIMNAQPARHLYQHIMECREAPTASKTKWCSLAQEKKRKASSQGVSGLRSPTKVRRIYYGGSVHSTPTKPNMSRAEEQEFHLEIALAFYTAGIPFRVIDNPYMRRALTRYRPGMKLPTRQSLATTFLDMAYKTEKDRLGEILKRQPRLVIITDGWSNVNRESVVNYVLTSPKMRPMMWSSGTTGSQAHTGEFMASEMSRVIGEVESVAGVGKVKAVVSDNAANMKKAGRLIEQQHPNVIFNGCSAHAVNLLLKDMFKIPFFADVLKNALKLVTFVRARHMLLGRVRAKRRQLPRRAKVGELSAPVSTRWYAQEKCIKSVVRNKSSLKAAFADQELMEAYSDPATATKLREVQSILRDKQFWRDAKIVLRLTKPITRALAFFEADTCCNSMILNEFDRLKKAAEYTKPVPGLADLGVQQKILELIDERWKFVCPPSNSTRIAYLLDPSKDTTVFTGNSLRDTVADAVKLAERFGLPSDVTPVFFRMELLDFIEMKRSRDEESKRKACLDTPLHWWLMDEDFPNLRHFAEKLLSIPTSSAASERLWSIHGFTQTKLRNRLRIPTLEKLAFIYANDGSPKPKNMPIYQTPAGVSDSDSDSESDDCSDVEDDDCLFDLRDGEYEYLLDAIVSVDIGSE